jgi:hypothetical protein
VPLRLKVNTFSVRSWKPTRFAGGTWVYADNYRLPAGNDAVDITMTALFNEPQWSKAIYPSLKGAKWVYLAGLSATRTRGSSELS